MQALVDDTHGRSDIGGNRSSTRGWVALGLSLLATAGTLAAITPLATGTGIPVLPPIGPDVLYRVAILACWPFILAAIVADLIGGARGGRNRWLGVIGGVALALAGAYAVSVMSMYVSILSASANS